MPMISIKRSETAIKVAEAESEAPFERSFEPRLEALSRVLLDR